MIIIYSHLLVTK